MSQSPIFDRIANLLKKESRIWSNDAEPKLLKGTLVSLANSDDADLLTLLLGDSTAREQFFVIAGDATVFRKERFIQFVTMDQFLPNSFTAFENKIGLTKDGKYLDAQNEVALVFPYKDCILEAGQTKEDKGRDEIFYNTVLAPDEIDRLKEPKVLTKWKRFTRDDIEGKQPVTEVSHTDNLVIKGNNLLALYSLLPRYRGQVKLIYIDPPYNTGNDGFRYNDSFNHSSWLVFIKNRLEVARELLREDGVIFVHCDNNEQAYLKVLMDEIFGRANFIETITVVNNPRGRDYGGVANMHEFINVFAKSETYTLYKLEEPDKQFPFTDKIGGFETRELRNRNIKFNEKNRPNLVYPFFVNPNKKDANGFYEISLNENNAWIKVMPAKSQGIQTVWRWGQEKARRGLNIGICAKQMQNGGWQIVEKYREKSTMARSVWWDKNVNSERGTLHLKDLFQAKLFDHPKPEETLHRIIEMSTKESDLILDFFAGSGTTCAVAHKMGRQYIGIEQMDYIHDLPEARLKKVIEGEQGGISKAVNWHGGGSFIYCELLEWNQRHINALEKASTKKEVEVVKAKMEREQFFRYNYDPSQWEGKAFDALSIDEQKRVLLDMLDMNHLYVNNTSIAETTFAVSDEDKALNKQFYTVTR